MCLWQMCICMMVVLVTTRVKGKMIHVHMLKAQAQLLRPAFFPAWPQHCNTEPLSPHGRSSQQLLFPQSRRRTALTV
jgi:hypothetical protein